MSDPTEQLIKMGRAAGLTIPPPAFVEFKGEMIAYDAEAQTLSVRFPLEERFTNPLGIIQGGVIAALIDNAIGPLSFLVAPPSVTRTMTIDYRKSLALTMEHVIVRARVSEVDERRVVLEADVLYGDVVCAHGRVENIILRR